MPRKITSALALTGVIVVVGMIMRSDHPILRAVGVLATFATLTVLEFVHSRKAPQ